MQYNRALQRSLERDEHSAWRERLVPVGMVHEAARHGLSVRLYDPAPWEHGKPT